MRAHEFMENKRTSHRGLKLSTIHGWKRQAEKQKRDDAEYSEFLQAMYGQGDPYEQQRHALELERERIAIARERAELDALKAEQGTEAYNTIKRLSRSAMRRRKKETGGS